MKVCDSKYCASLWNNDKDVKDDSTNLRKLVDTKWNIRVNRAEVIQIESKKRMKLAVLPLTEDLQLFGSYLVKNIEQFSGLLRRPSARPTDCIFLTKRVMCRLILFNRRLRAEVQEQGVTRFVLNCEFCVRNSTTGPSRQRSAASGHCKRNAQQMRQHTLAQIKSRAWYLISKKK